MDDIGDQIEGTIGDGSLTRVLSAHAANTILGQSHAEVRTLHDRIELLFRSYLAKATPDVREPLRIEGDPSSPVRHAYLLGQLSMAQAILGEVLGKIPTQAFHDALDAPENAPVLQALRDREIGIDEIALAASLDESVVQGVLTRLIQEGIVDFRNGFGGKRGFFVVPTVAAYLGQRAPKAAA